MEKKKRMQFVWIFLVSTAAFIFLSFMVHEDAFRTLDYNSLVFLQRAIKRSFDVPFSFFSILGSTEITLIILGIVFLGICIKIKKLFWGIFLYFLIFIIELAGKLVIFHPSVPSLFHRYALGIRLPSSSFVHTAFSFPSGHMARTSFLVFTILFLLLWRMKGTYKRIGYVLLLTFHLIGMFISRIYLGEHWLSDVIGGTLLGLNIASLAFVLW